MKFAQTKTQQALAWIGLFALAGALVPVILEMFWWGYNRAPFDITMTLAFERITLILWPPSIMLVCGCGGLVLVLISGLANIMLYTIIGAMVWIGVAKFKIFLSVPILSLAALWWWLLSL